MATNTSTSARTTVQKSQSIIGSVALALVVIGAINWGLVGLFDIDLVGALFGDMSVLSRIVYVLVGVAGVYALTLYPRITRAPASDTRTTVAG